MGLNRDSQWARKCEVSADDSVSGMRFAAVSDRSCDGCPPTNKPMLPLVYLALAMLLFVQRVDGRRCSANAASFAQNGPFDAGRMSPIQRVCRHLAAVGLIAIDGTQSARYGLAFGNAPSGKMVENVVRRLIAALGRARLPQCCRRRHQSRSERPPCCILIGTGILVPDADRSGPATLVEAGEQKLLFERGTGRRPALWQLKIPSSRVAPRSLTHLHSDHVVGASLTCGSLVGWVAHSEDERRRSTSSVRRAPKT